MLTKISRLLIPLVLLILISFGSQGKTKGQASSNTTYLPFITYNPAVWLGPYGGTITAIAVDPTNPQVVYAGTFGAGVYKSTDGGHIWTSTSIGLTNLEIYSLAIDPSHPSIIYAGTYKSQVFKSSDGGNSWSWSGNQMQPEAIVYSLAVDPKVSANVYAATRGISGGVNGPWKGVIYKSTDSGNSWIPSLSNVGTTQDWAYSLAINPNNPKQVFAAFHENGPYLLNDSGWHWIPDGVRDYSGRSIVISPLPDYSSTLYFGVWHFDAMYKTTNSGAVWTMANHDLLNVMVYNLALDPFDPDTVYMGTFNSGVLKTTDAGANWLPSGLLSDKLYSLIINPQITNNLFAGTSGDGLYRSDDFSVSWQHSDRGIDNAMVTSVINSPSDPNELYSGVYGGGIYQSSDQGKSWYEMNAGLGDKFVHNLVTDPTNSNVLYALTDTGGLFMNDLTSGNGWESTGKGLPLTSIPLSAYLENDPFATLDNLENFAAPKVLESETQATNVGLLTMVYAPSDARIVYMGTVGNGVYRSVDGGMSWIPFGLGGNNISSLAVDPTDPDLAYATVDYYGSMKVTTKGSEILWKDSSYLSANFYSVATSPYAPGKVYVGTSIGFYSYQNQTNAWTALGLSGETVTAVAVDPTHPGVLYAGTTNGAYYSLNYGSTWNLVDNRLAGQTITSKNFNKTNPELIYFSTKTHGIFLATLRF
jgi:photosystem II stability/assembly factor-like uncharacterized protein